MSTSIVKPLYFRGGETATFGVKTDLVAPWKYQWMRNGVHIGGSQAASYSTPPLQTADLTAKYSVTVWGQNTAETSEEVTLGQPVGPKPTPAEIAAASTVTKPATQAGGKLVPPPPPPNAKPAVVPAKPAVVEQKPFKEKW